jgi:hypothetical protein
MILGSEVRTPPEHRDRGHFLSVRLYPTAPFEPWEPASSYVQPTEGESWVEAPAV